MVKHIWSVLCGGSSVDTETNNLSLYNELEELNVTVSSKVGERISGPISVPVDYEIITLLFRDVADDSEKVDQVFEVVYPDGKVGMRKEHNLEMPKGARRFRWRAKVRGFVVNSPGTYWFVVSVRQQGEDNFRKVAEIPLDVKPKVVEKEKFVKG